MTAVVGILNKQAVALAADSAVTISGSNNRKIFNRANKVFTLSKYHPVGVMLYNSASFMATPWETIIKTYRKKLGKDSFPTVKAYQDDFIQFLHEKNLFSDEATQKNFLFSFCFSMIDVITKDAVRAHRNLLQNPTYENQQQIIDLLDAKADEVTQQLETNLEICEEFENYTLENFSAFADDLYAEVISQEFTNNGFVLPPELITKFKSILHQYLRRKEAFTNFTGLVFVGFGEEEIYPQLLPVNISLAVQQRLRYFADTNNEASISNLAQGAIRPFAQTDVIDTILTGIDPTLDNTYLKNFVSAFTKYNQEILGIIGDANPELAAQIQGLDVNALAEAYAAKNNETKRSNYIDPLMNAVSNLSKEDLAEMAESLIYLTYLKRRITFAEESVGGPVDVAIISKGDGFIWIKRKHYFRQELNQHFLDNYFNT
ncbi:MAG: hypothetical protein K1X61_02960 [Chitinophagales bacterium]|nr:hypothetical protein [Chitinophagales bacterium]